MESLNLQPTRNVAIGIDVQKDFISGSLAVKEGADVVAPLNNITRRVRETGGTVVFTRDWHPETTPHFEKWAAHCVAGTEGAEFDDNLEIDPDDIIISKGMGQTDGYSGMEGVGPRGQTIERIVRPRSRLERVRVLVGGLTTEYCVNLTVLGLAKTFKYSPNVSLYLARDAVRAVDIQPGDGEKAIKAMEQAGIQALSSEEILRTFFAPAETR